MHIHHKNTRAHLRVRGKDCTFAAVTLTINKNNNIFNMKQTSLRFALASIYFLLSTLAFAQIDMQAHVASDEGQAAYTE